MQRVLAFASLIVVGAAGCADSGDEGILVTKNVVPGTGCTFLGDMTEGFFPNGQWSTLSPGGYLFSPQMNSRITALMGEENERTIIVDAADIDLTIDPSLNVDSSLTHFKAPFSVPLPPIVNGSLTTADGQFQLIPRGVIDAVIAANPNVNDENAPTFSTLIQATFTVTGKMSGQDVTSQPFQYGVTLANDVVVQRAGACPVAGGTTINTGNPCNPFQDGLITCCTDMNNDLICPASTQ